jgi:hypothetical protein
MAEISAQIQEYIEKIKDYRLVAKYGNGESIYIHGKFPLNKSLGAFEKFGKPEFIQECVQGRRITVWDRFAGWSELEKRLTESSRFYKKLIRYK